MLCMGEIRRKRRVMVEIASDFMIFVDSSGIKRNKPLHFQI